MSKALVARNKLRARKAAYDRKLEDMSDNQIAAEIDYLEDLNPRPGTFNAWALRSAMAELDHRL